MRARPPWRHCLASDTERSESEGMVFKADVTARYSWVPSRLQTRRRKGNMWWKEEEKEREKKKRKKENKKRRDN